MTNVIGLLNLKFLLLVFLTNNVGQTSNPASYYSEVYFSRHVNKGILQCLPLDEVRLCLLKVWAFLETIVML